MSTTKTACHIRWMIRRDMPEVLDIEAESFGDDMWLEEDFIRALRQRNCIGIVAEQKDLVVGFMIYELHKHKIDLMNFAVGAEYRRQGIGTAMAEKLKGKLSLQRRRAVTLLVHERNKPAQLFWRAVGFRATRVLRDYFLDGDGYQFTYNAKE